MDNCLRKKSEFRLDEAYKVGENRPITLGIKDSSRAIYNVTEAEYLITNKLHKVVAQGQCTIDNDKHTVSLYFNPRQTGLHTIEMTITIPPAIRIIDLIADVSPREGMGD